MFDKSIKTLTLSASAVAIALMTFAAAQTASAHPHNLLAMCQLPDGSWVACDQTIHDTLTGEHKPASGAVRPGSKIQNLSTKPRRQRTQQIGK